MEERQGHALDAQVPQRVVRYVQRLLQGSESRVWGAGFGVEGAVSKVWGSGFGIQGLEFGVWGLGCRV